MYEDREMIEWENVNVGFNSYTSIVLVATNTFYSVCMKVQLSQLYYFHSIFNFHSQNNPVMLVKDMKVITQDLSRQCENYFILSATNK